MVAAVPGTLAAESVVIAAGGQAQVPIVIAPDASEAMKESAGQLVDVLNRMTGAKFAVEQSEDPRGITLGTLAQFPDQALAVPLAIRDGYDGIEAFAIRTDPDKGVIRILGNSDLGVSHGVFRFLDLLGCRWFFPGPVWEVLPEQADLRFGENVTSRPEIWSRDIWFGRTAQPWEKGDPNGTALFNLWKKQNLWGESLKVNVSHRWHAIPKEFPDEFAAHPEYYALVSGKRTGPQLCVTNPGLQKLVFRSVDAYFAKNPEADMASLDPADWPDWCTCPDCAKLGHHSNQAFYLANLAARELQKTHPGKYVGVLAYSWHSDAPPFVLEPNVYVQLTAGMNASKFRFDELFKLWTEKCSHLGIYEYYSYWQMDKAMLPGTGVSNRLDDLAERIGGFVDNKVNSVSAQSANCWGVNGLGYYLAGKLMWNAKADVPALKKDFYRKAFGPAAAVMERYYERLNLSNHPLPGAGLLRLCLEDLEEASVAAAGNADVMARLDALKENLIYNDIGRKVENALTPEEKKTRTLEWMTWSYRTRNNYMNDWITFRSTVGRPAADEFKEPDWFWRNTVKTPEKNPWRVNEPVTAQEREERLRTIKRELGEVPVIPERKFSADHVLVDFGGKAKEIRQTFGGNASYLTASPDGAPLRFQVVKNQTVIRLGEGVVGFEAPRDMAVETPDTTYALRDAAGREVAVGRLPVGKHELVLKVPAAGIYRLDFRNEGGEWEVVFPAECPAALVFEHGGSCKPERKEPFFFYVPKGLKEIAFYVRQGSKISVSDPNGRIVHDAVSRGEYVSLPVPKGMDGKVWSLQGEFSGLWFFNLPTMLASDPVRIFLPAEIADVDGLTPPAAKSPKISP